MPDDTQVTAPPAPEGTISDTDAERIITARREARERNEATGADAEPRKGQDLLRAATKVDGTKATELKDEEIVAALDHFLATEQDAEEEIEPKALKLNVGTKEKPAWIRWVIVPVDDTEITRMRKNSQAGTRAQRRRGEAEVDEALVSRKLVVRGTVEPDIGDLARTMDSGPDPADAVHAYFKKFGKTGLITQISGEILSISGWDDEDVQEVQAAQG